MKGLGKRMAIRRKEIGYTPARVAKMCDMSVSYYHFIETGRADPTLADLEAIAEVLRIRPEYLIGSEPKGGVQVRTEKTPDGYTIIIDYSKEYQEAAFVDYASEGHARLVLKRAKS
jgi:transcriptional regulator with XRE-family HTH domain